MLDKMLYCVSYYISIVNRNPEQKSFSFRIPIHLKSNGFIHAPLTSIGKINGITDGFIGCG